MMRFLSIPIFLLLSHGVFAQYDWVDKSPPTTSQLNDVEFINNYYGYCSGWDGALFLTFNGGDTWFPRNSPLPPSHICAETAFTDVANGYWLSTDCQIYKTTDTCTTWSHVYTNTNKAVFSHAFVGNRFLVGRNSDVLYTDDGGSTWDSTDCFTGWVRQMSFCDASNGYAVGLNNVATTSDGGTTWQLVTSYPSAFAMGGVKCFSPDEAIIVGESGEIWKTVNGGDSWTSISSPTSDEIYTLSFANATHSVAVGYNNTVIETEDGGDSWDNTPLTGAPGSTLWLDVAAMNEITAYICGTGGRLFRSPNADDIESLDYLGPDTVCVGQAFDFTIEFANVGVVSSPNPGFTVLAGGSSLFGNTISYGSILASGDTVTITESAILTTPGINSVIVFSTEQNNQNNNYLYFDIFAVEPAPTDVLGSTNFCPGDTIQIEASGGNQYFWQNGVGSDITNPVQEVNPTQTELYIVEIHQDFCIVEDSVWLYLDAQCDTSDNSDTVYTTSESLAFSPNFDGVNDYLYLDFIDPNSENNAVTIYNRWGDVVFETRNYNNDDNYWDGTFGNRNSPPGTYFLVAETSHLGVVKAWIQIVK